MKPFYFYSIGFISASFLFFACASFPYKWGVLNLEDYKIQYKNNDRSLDICKRNDAGEFTCIIIEIDEFFRLKEDYEKCINK